MQRQSDGIYVNANSECVKVFRKQSNYLSGQVGVVGVAIFSWAYDPMGVAWRTNVLDGSWVPGVVCVLLSTIFNFFFVRPALIFSAGGIKIVNPLHSVEIKEKSISRVLYSKRHVCLISSGRKIRVWALEITPSMRISGTPSPTDGLAPLPGIFSPRVTSAFKFIILTRILPMLFNTATIFYLVVGISKLSTLYLP